MRIRRSDRLNQMGSAIFAEVAIWKQEAIAKGHELIDLGIGSPDQPPSLAVRQALSEAVLKEGAYGYPSSEGSDAFRRAVVDWYRHRFGVQLDSATEVVTLMGSQDGLAHLPAALCNPGDIAMIPDPGYPIYSAGLAMAGVEPYYIPLREANGYMPDLESIPSELCRRARYMLLNYPSNPLAAVADLDFFERLIHFARQHDLLIVHDLAYSEMAFDGYRPHSILEVPGAKDVAIEFHSLSKMLNMAGCRIAFAVGCVDAVRALRDLKANIDYGVFLPVQEAGVVALRESMRGADAVASLYQDRRDKFVTALLEAGWPVDSPRATMFIWAKIPQGWTSRQISREICLNTGVVVIPGDAFGNEGEGYVRIAMVQEEAKLVEAAARIGRFLQA